MNNVEKELLLKDLCARLPYGVKVHMVLYGATTLNERHIESFKKGYDDALIPYIRPMSSMTEEERIESLEFAWTDDYGRLASYNENIPKYIDWLNAHHFDYRGLIPMGLALEAPKGMYGMEDEK